MSQSRTPPAQSRRHGYEADAVETAAAVRWALEREDAFTHDAVATAASPLPAGTLVECKACRVWIENGDAYGTTGRWHVVRSTHEDLLAAGGHYALAVYRAVAVDGDERVCIERLELVDAREVDRLLPDLDSRALKLPWTAVFDTRPRGCGR